MPFESKAQQRFMFATNPGTARRWAQHTPDMKKLPERAGAGSEKRAFAAAFVMKCAAAGLTRPDQVAAAAEALIKRALDLGELAGNALGKATLAPILGTVALPMAAGGLVGGAWARARNETDVDDLETLRTAAEANAYRRRAALAQAHAQVRKLLASDPKRYAVIG